MQGDGGGHGWRIRSGLVQDSSRLQVLLESHSVLVKASHRGKEPTWQIHIQNLHSHRP